MFKRPNARLAALTALVATAAACSDQPTGLELVPEENPRLYTSSTDLSGATSPYTDSDLLNAVKNGFSSSSSFGALSHGGGAVQVGLRTVAEKGLPSDGGDYLIVTSGDARDITGTNGYYAGSCGAVRAGFCDVGGLSIPVAIPLDGQKLEFDVRYFSHDDANWPDPFRIHLSAGLTTSLVKELTTTGEFSGTLKASGSFAWSPTLHHIVLDVSAYAGQTVTLHFEASDTDDGWGGLLDSGAAIDNIRVIRSDALAPAAANLLANPNPAAINTDITLTALIDDRAAGGSTIAGAEYSLDAGATWKPMSAKDGVWNTDREEVVASLGQFASPTVKEIWVRGKDAAGNVGAHQLIELAVYDPNGSYIAGSGAIDSPLGAYAADPSLTGTAHFGFSSKYKSGTTIPEGNTRFTFRTASFKFESVSYDWLVVSGAKGQFKGSGTINGAGDYGFKLTGVDGALSGGGGVDKFRIKVWDKATGAVIYDNEMNVEDGSDPTTAIRNGNVMIK